MNKQGTQDTKFDATATETVRKLGTLRRPPRNEGLKPERVQES